MFRILLIIAILLPISFEKQQLGKCMVAITITPSKSFFVLGEPIELQVSLANKGSSDVAVAINYPSFRAYGVDGILFTDNKKIAPQSGGPSGFAQYSGRAFTQKIAANNEWTTKIYLQAYFQNLTQGDYRINYSLDLPCLNENGSLKDIIRARGSVIFNVKPSDQGALQEIIKAYASQLESTNFWDIRTAEEALAATDDPIVVPELAKLIRLGDSEIAFKSLSKFKGDVMAEALVQESLRSKVISHQLLSLDVLSKWKAMISDADLKALLESKERRVRIAALLYVRSVHNPAYLPVIEEYIQDPDPSVSEEAKRTKRALQGKP